MSTLAPPLKPMLLTPIDAPPNGPYIHQLKFDGIRCLLFFDRKTGVRLYTRHGNTCTRQFPELQSVSLDAETLILDGELVVFRDGKPFFESVMRRFQTTNGLSMKRLTDELPAHLVAFDVIERNGHDLTNVNLPDRLDILQGTVHSSEVLSVCESFEDGAGLFKATKNMDLEGVVSKFIGKGSRYELATRSKQWYKAKNYQYSIVTIAALRKRQFGWSLIEGDKYVGIMEFVPPMYRKALYRVARKIVRAEDDRWMYLEPVIQCKVKFQSYTKAGMMRSPAFVEFVLAA